MTEKERVLELLLKGGAKDTHQIVEEARVAYSSVGGAITSLRKEGWKIQDNGYQGSTPKSYWIFPEQVFFPNTDFRPRHQEDSNSKTLP